MLSYHKIKHGLLAFTVIYSVYKCSTPKKVRVKIPIKDKVSKVSKVSKVKDLEETSKVIVENDIELVKSMVIRNSEDFYNDILQYIYEKYPTSIDNFNYSVEDIPHFNEFRYRRAEKSEKYRIFQPENCKI